MSILRSATKLHASVRQCARLVTAAQQHRRGYADMAFTFASPVEVYEVFMLNDSAVVFDLRCPAGLFYRPGRANKYFAKTRI